MAPHQTRTAGTPRATLHQPGCRVNISRSRNAFTIIEIIVVMVVLGIMVAMVAPMVTSGGDVSRVRTATRGFTQMSRYARTMAVLHQSATELSFSEDGKLSVVLEGGGNSGGESIVSAKSFAVTNAVAAAEAARMEEMEAEPSGTPDGGGGGSYAMAEVDTHKDYERVCFTFLGYTDTADAGRYSHLLSPPKNASAADDKEDEDEENARAARVRYKSNGTCRPYRVKVSAEGDNAFSLTVAVDMLGSARVEEDAE
ncbi:MAG: prepilin-type N-terminal cleavage/methylation domain-containing protein [Kiritimatiellaeota bacterium]|nr:prepilin-type N-terminal cleavage/methylation domain-containing protein [Kiritimatiellota bacterium]